MIDRVDPSSRRDLFTTHAMDVIPDHIDVSGRDNKCLNNTAIGTAVLDGSPCKVVREGDRGFVQD